MWNLCYIPSSALVPYDTSEDKAPTGNTPRPKENSVIESHCAQGPNLDDNSIQTPPKMVVPNTKAEVAASQLNRYNGLNGFDKTLQWRFQNLIQSVLDN